MTAEQFFCVVMIVFVVAITILKMLATDWENDMILKQNIETLKVKVDDAWALYEVAQTRHDHEQSDRTKAIEKKAREEYLYWKGVLEMHQRALAA